MKQLMNLAMLSVAILTAGCNEKVTPELQEGATSSTIPTAVPPSEYYFKLSNTSSYLLNYKLHKTGDGNATAACETRKNVPLSNSLYKDGADPDSDITCYLEAEELALYAGGINLEVSASANTCEYVGYSPFSYYNRQPGDSSSTLYEVECASNTVTDADVIAELGATVAIENGADTAGCSEYVDRDIPVAERTSFLVNSDADLCRFNYQDGDKEKCDIGVITVRKYKVDPGNPLTFTERRIECGGKAAECVKGPIKEVTNNFSTATVFYSTNTNQAISKPFTYPAPITTQSWNGTLVNFRRNLASPDIDYGDSSTYDPVTYMAKFGNQKDFNPLLMDRYSNNRKMDGNSLIDSATYTYWSYVWDSTKTWKLRRARPLAAEPFMGMAGYRTNPYYTFYCLDGALDIKSRIRLVVRDWDRVFPSNDKLELISDINLLTNARQDVYLSEEIPDDQDNWNMFNDKGDWDDLVQLPMVRSAGAFDPTNTTWAPKATNGPSGNFDEQIMYSDGFFNPYIFPNEVKQQF